MIYWDKIIESRVVDTFRNICYKWWCIDIQFYDEYGICKSKNLPFQNPFCHLMHSKTNGAKHCYRNYKKYRKELSKSLKPFIYNCHSGLDVIAVPLFVKDRYVGAIVGSGIKLSKIKNPGQQIDIMRLTTFGFDKADLEQSYNKLKPINKHREAYIIDFMELVATDVMAFYELLQEKEELSKRQRTLRDSAHSEKYKGIIGTSRSMKKIFTLLDLIEESESPVLIEGETGTGKELIAAAIHYNSPRRDKMFVIQNCSAFSDSLLSSELFGHEKGSFTGAISEKKGLFDIADKGTLFLDELGDMNLEAQARLLRVLENGTFCRVGGTEQKKVDIRIIAATNKELSNQIKKGLFRKDLFYRINTFHIDLPPSQREGRGYTAHSLLLLRLLRGN